MPPQILENLPAAATAEADVAEALAAAADVEANVGKKRKDARHEKKAAALEGPKISLSEVGPRFVLVPVKIFEGSFSGATVYENQGAGSSFRLADAGNDASAQSGSLRRPSPRRGSTSERQSTAPPRTTRRGSTTAGRASTRPCPRTSSRRERSLREEAWCCTVCECPLAHHLREEQARLVVQPS
jgi:hypothetical protein